MSKKMNLREFMVAREDWELTEKNLQWADRLLAASFKEGFHNGDCTTMPITCLLCSIEGTLSDYREYRFAKTPTCQWCEGEIPKEEYLDAVTPLSCKACHEKFVTKKKANG